MTYFCTTKLTLLPLGTRGASIKLGNPLNISQFVNCGATSTALKCRTRKCMQWVNIAQLGLLLNVPAVPRNHFGRSRDYSCVTYTLSRFIVSFG